MAIDDGPWTDVGALFSSCRRWRYRLWRAWDESLPRCVFLMLNPSVANEQKLDPTVRRCVVYARDWGCGSLDVINLFAWVDGHPSGLLTSPDPVGPENDREIELACRGAHIICCAWGNWKQVPQRANHVRYLLRDYPLSYLKLTTDGQPVHPLRQLRELKPTPFPKVLWAGIDV